ncbi:MFS transporter [Rhizobacter sp. AJA081-3]|uniref:MFS transporter n=1 Tax=Rhizobacter sp. AJA081-3 TaxID=2753607 RepID=UPI001ADFEF07|nr:MFS transporter [Rhizobacter sp. AJA081-3]QTN21418.1 MFS transporter [Rhizobacter sp. AJA081-3]
MTPVPKRILPVIAISQFAGTSVWFAINAVMADLQRSVALPASAVGWLTAAVQVGFILGTFGFALLSIADRFSPRKVFLVCSLFAAALALATALLPPQYGTLLALRFLTGIALAGIYPVGMKIAAGWFAHGLGWALGVLVGALVLGNALPFGLRALGAQWSWQAVMLAVAAVAAGGGVLMAVFVPDGPHLAPAARITPRALGVIWHDRKVRASAFGYFGHMWELYAFFVLIPAIVALRWQGAAASWWVAAAMAVGGLACVIGGALVRRVGGARVAGFQLASSGLCGLLAPWMLDAPLPLWGAWLLWWGATVSGDSPQFSALTAANAPRAMVGSVLTFVNAIGFTLSVGTITLFAAMASVWPLAQVLPWLAVGPAIGLLFLRPLWRS